MVCARNRAPMDTHTHTYTYGRAHACSPRSRKGEKTGYFTSILLSNPGGNTVVMAWKRALASR